MKVTALGTGTPESTSRRASSGYLVEIGPDRILLDCGGGVVDRLIASGRLPKDITHLFFSHLHSDHMMDYARLVHAAWDEGAEPLRVWGPPPIKAITTKLFGRDGVFDHDLRARTEMAPSQLVWKNRGGTLPRPWPKPVVTEIQPGFSFDGTGWSLSSCEVAHAQPILSCMAFRIEYQGKVFVYSGDAALSDDLESLCANADLLIHWCYRFDDETAMADYAHLTPTPSEIATMAERAAVKDLRLTHIRTHNDASERLEMARSAAAQVFSGKIAILEDGDQFTF